VSCAAGESRSVSISIGAIAIFESMIFPDACKLVFNAVQGAYPHPSTLVSVGNYCKASLNLDELKNIYSQVAFPPPFPWQEEDLILSLKLNSHRRLDHGTRNRTKQNRLVVLANHTCFHFRCTIWLGCRVMSLNMYRPKN